jgi:mannose-1-phosphate guanylyltransferase
LTVEFRRRTARITRVRRPHRPDGSLQIATGWASAFTRQHFTGMIQAAILAGGLGTRMRPFTETLPKPMLPVLNRPFLEHQIELLERIGIHNFLLLVGYLGHAIEAHFGSRWGDSAHIAYSYEEHPMGTGGALKLASDKLDDDFLLINGDTLLDIDYPSFIEQFRASGKQALIAAYLNGSGHVPSNLEIAADSSVRSYTKCQNNGSYIDAGVIALRKSVLTLIPEGRPSSLEEEVFPELIATGELRAWPTETAFFDMGTPAGLKRLELHLGMQPQ